MKMPYRRVPKEILEKKEECEKVDPLDKGRFTLGTFKGRYKDCG